MATDMASLVQGLRGLVPFENEAAATAALTSTIEALADFLTSDERAAFARELPPAFAKLTGRDEVTEPADPYALGQLAAARSGVTFARALEESEVVCRLLGQALGPEAVARLARALPGLARLFEPAPPAPELEHAVVHASGHRHDLAEGREGGAHPLAAAHPAMLAHRESIARSDDPHAETRISSAHGLTQEREERTLSTGGPGSRHPVSRDH